MKKLPITYKGIMGLLIAVLLLPVFKVEAAEVCTQEQLESFYNIKITGPTTESLRSGNKEFNVNVILRKNKATENKIKEFQKMKFKVVKIFPDTARNRHIVDSLGVMEYSPSSTAADIGSSTATIKNPDLSDGVDDKGNTTLNTEPIDKSIRIYIESVGKDPVCNSKIYMNGAYTTTIMNYPKTIITQDDSLIREQAKRAQKEREREANAKHGNIEKWATGEYKARWDEWAAKAHASGNVINLGEVGTLDKKTIADAKKTYKNELSCNFILDKNQIELIKKYNRSTKIDKETGQDLYYYDPANEKYYMATLTQKVTMKYSYHFEGNGHSHKGSAKTENVSCKRECSEVVKVEYGPPVAIRGGQCFQYQVKVTSYVACKIKERPEKPKDYQQCGGIYPRCTRAMTDKYMAGPNDNFDECVKKCDGGKYTSKCSKSCYKKVYGKKKTKEKLLSNTKGKILKVNETAAVSGSIWDLMQQRANAMNHYYHCGTSPSNMANHQSFKGGYYVFNGAGTLSYRKAVGGGSEYIRWYDETGYPELYVGDIGDTSKHPSCSYIGRFDGVGASLVDYNGTPCNDDCTIYYNATGADGKECYLNSTNLDARYTGGKGTQKTQDYRANMAVYDELINKCESLATCNTESTTYIIEAKVNDNGNVFKTTKFDNHQDTLKKNGSGNPKLNTKNNGLNYVIDYQGCYNKQEESGHYETEWSPEGTWMENKSGIVTYGKKPGKFGYEQYEKEICLPRRTPEINAAWWHVYMSYYATSGTEKEEAGRNLQTNFGRVNIDLTNKKYNNNTTVEGANIQGRVRDFGYFNWSFDINCFYAASSAQTPIVPPKKPVESTNKECKPLSETSTCQVGCPCVSEYNFTVRNVDNKELFPQAGRKDDGTASVERKPGFNWTQEATIPEEKNPNYAINPEKLKQKVEASNYDAYDENKLDYEFTLTRGDIAKIRKDNKKQKNYTDFQGGYENKNGVIAYSLTDTIARLLTPNSTRSRGINNKVDQKGSKNPEAALKGAGGNK